MTDTREHVAYVINWTLSSQRPDIRNSRLKQQNEYNTPKQMLLMYKCIHNRLIHKCLYI